VKRSCGENQTIKSPVGKEKPVQKTGNFCLHKTPAGDYILINGKKRQVIKYRGMYLKIFNK